jgi:hypothetical protein
MCVCDVCGSHYQHGYKSKHVKTKTHQRALQQKLQTESQLEAQNIDQTL